MFVYHLQGWPNFGPTLGGCLVFAVVEYSTQGTPADARSAAVSWVDSYQGPIGLYGSACCVTHIALLNQRKIIDQ